jgi:hypothetical protein
MKQRNAMIAVWTALLIAIGLTLAMALGSGSAGPERDDMRLGEKRLVAVNPDAVEVRLFVSGTSTNVSARAQELIGNRQGIALTRDQRAILDRSLYRHRASVYDQPAAANCVFDPHHIFRYFDAKGEQVGELQVCFCCRDVFLFKPDHQRLGGEEEYWEFDFDGLAAMLQAADIPTDIDCPGRG